MNLNYLFEKCSLTYVYRITTCIYWPIKLPAMKLQFKILQSCTLSCSLRMTDCRCFCILYPHHVQECFRSLLIKPDIVLLICVKYNTTNTSQTCLLNYVLITAFHVFHHQLFFLITLEHRSVIIPFRLVGFLDTSY